MAFFSLPIMLKAKQTQPQEVVIYPDQFRTGSFVAKLATYVPNTTNSYLSFVYTQDKFAYVKIPHVVSRPTTFTARALVYTPANITNRYHVVFKINASYQQVPSDVNEISYCAEEAINCTVDTRNLITLSYTIDSIKPTGRGTSCEGLDLIIQLYRDVSEGIRPLNEEIRLLKLMLTFE